jgi:hypothetical protein
MLTQNPGSENSSATHCDNALRALVLASLYGGAVFFAVVFSPSMGFSPHPPHQSMAAGASPGGLLR